MTQRQIRVGVCCAVTLLLTLAVNRVWAAEPYYIEPFTLPASDVPQALASGINPQGWQLYTETNGLKEAICQVYMAKSVAGQVTPAPGKLRYTVLRPGALVGLVHLLPEATDDYAADTHEQKLKPGYYTMRYAVMPAGTYAKGPVLGEFVVLIPAAQDQDPSRVLDKDQLDDLAANSGTDSPATMALAAPESGVHKLPKVSMDEQGVCTFQAQVQMAPSGASAAKPLDIAIVMLTPIPHPEGS